MNLKGKVAIITGGGTGIGFGIAQVLAEKDAKLALVQPLIETAQRAAAQLKQVETLAVAADIRDPDAVQRMVDSVLRQFGKIDILVNNASITGMPAIAPMLQCDSTQVDEIVDVNLKGTFYCSKAVAKHMVSVGTQGSIVHIASVGAYAAQEFAILYCATKAAQVSMAQAMALELAPHKIRVNCIAPGDISTDTNAHTKGHIDKMGISLEYVRATPLGHPGSPRDIGQAVAFLVSEDAGFVTGTTLTVDGGFLAY